jgi:hypothetical protein
MYIKLPLMPVIQTLELSKLLFVIQIQGFPLIVQTQGVPLIIWTLQGTTAVKSRQKGKPLTGGYIEPVLLRLPYWTQPMMRKERERTGNEREREGKMYYQSRMEGEVELRNFLVAEGQTACLLHPARKSRP